jgi:ABC-type Zn uptake system ZnuABC Zn-binding protein ZnuA
MQRMPVKRLFTLVLLAALGGCASASAAQSRGPIQVVTTISTFNSLVTGVGGNLVHVQNLVPVGASPETYEPTPQDAVMLSQAQLLIENGAGLESWLAPTLKNVTTPNLKVVVESDGLQVENKNPHLWMDPENAKIYVDKIRAALSQMDPPHAAVYRTNAAAYDRQLDALSRSIHAKIATIPQSQRYMIVFHNAWQYYNNRFGVVTLGFIEANPGQDPNPEQVAHLIDLARAHHVRAIFSEPEYSKKLAEQIASNASIHVVDDLYDDSLGTDPRVHDYISMLNYDTDVIVKALK